MGKLFVIPTPIGNLEDISFRAIRILKEVDLILVEDTRNTGILLKHYEISKPLKAHHQFNEHKTLDSVIEIMKEGKKIGLVSDAGTPGISDPGFLLVRACLEADIPVECLPGPTAFLPATVLSGLPCDKFHFEGFLPHKKGRKTRLEQLAEYRQTLVFYESPHRLLKTLSQFAEYFGGERKISVSREISKIHEETIRGTIIEVIDHFKEEKIRGEFVIVVAGNDK